MSMLLYVFYFAIRAIAHFDVLRTNSVQKYACILNFQVGSEKNPSKYAPKGVNGRFAKMKKI